MSKEKICKSCSDLFITRGYKCQPCYQKEYYLANKDKIRLKKQKYYLANKEQIDASSKEYTIKNKNKVLKKNIKYYEMNKNKILSYQKEIRHTPKRKFSQAIKSSKERNLEWSISYDEYVNLISNPCHYCGALLNNFGGSSLDRVDNSVGYIITNVLPCCGACNNIRNNFLSVKEMEVAMAAVVEFRKRGNNET